MVLSTSASGHTAQGNPGKKVAPADIAYRLTLAQMVHPDNHVGSVFRGSVATAEDRRTFDLTILGVTGYTGKLVAAYLNELRKRGSVHLPSSERICFAGRDTKRVSAIAKQFSSDLNPATAHADVFDEASIYRIAAESKVILSCVGPYDIYGEVVVKACVSHGTDYVDVTGEGRWVEAMKKRYDDSARRNGVILIPFAGHDCVPVDVCAWFTTSQIAPKEMEESHASLITAMRFPRKGTLSHGSFNTVLRFAEQNKLEQYDDIVFPKARLSKHVQLVKEIPADHGGPLAILPTRVLVDGKIIQDTHERQPHGRAGVFESINGIVFPNRVIAATSWVLIQSLPFVLKLPFVLNMLQSTMKSGDAISSKKKNEAVDYTVFGILNLFPLKSGVSLEPPVETIVTRLDVDRDPYEVTAICCAQISLALANREFRATCLGVQTGFGFHTPVSAIGGQEILDRCYECFKSQLIARL